MILNPNDRQLRVVFRYDDYSAHSPTEWEERLIEAFRARNLSCAFGIVPFACQDPMVPDAIDRKPLCREKITLLRRAMKSGTVEPMLHGLTHRRLHPSKTPTQHPSEFAGLDRDQQRALLAEGRSSLETFLDAPVRIFAPPWNSYDRVTVEALEDLRFDVLSAGPRFGAGSDSLRLLPATCLLTSLDEAIDIARRTSDSDSWIVALFHSYDFTEVDEDQGRWTLGDLEKLLDRALAQEDLGFCSFDDTIEPSMDLGRSRYRLHRSLRHGRRLIPRFLRGRYRTAPGVYVSRRRATLWVWWNRCLGFAYYATWVLASAGVASLMAWQPLRWLVPSIGVFVLAYSFRRFRVTYKGATACALVAGLTLGLWWPA